MRRASTAVRAWPYAALVVVLALMVPASRAARAQQQPADAADLETRYRALLDSVLVLDSAVAAIDGWMIGTDGDDGRLLAERRDARIDSRRALLWRLADAVPDLPDASERAARTSALDSLLATDADELRSDALELVEEASRLRVDLQGLEGAERGSLEQRIRRMERAIESRVGAYHTTLVQRESLGSDVSSDLNELDRYLRVRAEILAARMTAAEEEVEALRLRLEEGEADLEAEVVAAGARVSETAAALTTVLDLMEERELETAEYRRDLLVTTGDLSAENLSWGVVRGLLGEWVAQATAWMRSNGANMIFQALLFVAIIGVFWLAARVMRRLLIGALATTRVEMSDMLRETIVRWTTRFVMGLGILIALSQLGVEIAPLLAGLGVAGFIVGFALQDSLSNLAAGVMILLYRPFDVGDAVEVGGAIGKIAEVSLVTTTILSFDNQRYVVPNNKIWGDIIKNVTAEGTRRVDLVFGIGYQDDIAEAERVLKETLETHELVLAEPEPVVKVVSLGDSAVELVARPWCRTEDYWTVLTDLTRTVKLRFDEEGISFPFPQRDVHVYHEPADADGPAESSTVSYPGGR